MAERSVNDEFWSDPFVKELPKDGKHLYLWFMTNNHLNPSGIFECSLKTISQETEIDIKDLPALLGLLADKVVWIQDKKIFWTKNFTRRQCHNAKFLLGAVPYLRVLKNGTLKDDFLAYNAELFGRYSIDMVSVLYGYGRDTALPDLTLSNTNTGTNTNKGFSFVTFLYELHEKYIGKVPANMKAPLEEVAQKYPEDMIRAAFEEMATKADKPCWKYVESVLGAWEAKGYQGQKGGKGKPKPGESHEDFVARYQGRFKKRETV